MLIRNNSDLVYKFDNERIPFENPKQPANCAYKYRTWNLGTFDNGAGKKVPLTLVSRTEHDAVNVGPSKDQVQKLTM